MKNIFVLIALFAITSSAWANADLARKNSCMSCHAIDRKLVGPAYQDVAKKYASQNPAQAEATLVKNIKAGGNGKWGVVAMPAQDRLSDADAKTLAAWILAGAK